MENSQLRPTDANHHLDHQTAIRDQNESPSHAANMPAAAAIRTWRDTRSGPLSGVSGVQSEWWFRTIVVIHELRLGPAIPPLFLLPPQICRDLLD